MKKLLSACLLALTITTAIAQNQVFYGGKTARLRVPVLTTNRDYLFPSFDLQSKSYTNDTLTVTINELETEVHLDSIDAATWLLLSPGSRMTPGGKLYLHLSTTGAAQTVSVIQGAYAIDEIKAGSVATTVQYVFDGTKYVKLGQTWPHVSSSITQMSSITTGVTCNADAGVITTVSATIPADDSSEQFTLTNSFIKSDSKILLTAGTAGNGLPYPTIVSQTNGSAVIKLSNIHRQAALNNTVKIHFWILNK
ncbi:MAG TPA: hypothetical protein VK154_13985 [Chitinophagales bacterium]|nr:hypothetical protein [Chitinophagales bacterium]